MRKKSESKAYLYFTNCFCYAVTSKSVSIHGLQDPLGDDVVENDPMGDGVDVTFDDTFNDAVQELGNIFILHPYMIDTWHVHIC